MHQKPSAHSGSSLPYSEHFDPQLLRSTPADLSALDAALGMDPMDRLGKRDISERRILFELRKEIISSIGSDVRIWLERHPDTH